MTLLILFGILVAITVALMIVYSQQRRGLPDDLEATRRAAAHGPRAHSNSPDTGMPDFGGGVPGA